MAKLRIQLPDAHVDRLKAMAAQSGLSLNKLMEEVTVQAWTEHDTKSRFRIRAARGAFVRGLKLFDELDRRHAKAMRSWERIAKLSRTRVFITLSNVRGVLN